MTTWLILTRTIHFGACLLFFGLLAFDRFAAAPVLANGKASEPMISAEGRSSTADAEGDAELI